MLRHRSPIRPATPRRSTRSRRDNPFAAARRRRPRRDPGDFGLRNPWRFSLRPRHRRSLDRRRRPGRASRRSTCAPAPRRAAGHVNCGWKVMEANSCANPDAATLPGVGAGLQLAGLHAARRHSYSAHRRQPLDHGRLRLPRRARAGLRRHLRLRRLRLGPHLRAARDRARELAAQRRSSTRGPGMGVASARARTASSTRSTSSATPSTASISPRRLDRGPRAASSA